MAASIPSVQPLSKMPSTLLKLSAETVARDLIRKSLPAIIECVPIMDDEPPGILSENYLDYLRKLKTWYWEELKMEPDNITFRMLISNSLNDLLDVFEVVQNCHPIHKLGIQMMFGWEAGDVHGEVDQISASLSLKFSNFLEALIPFHIRNFQDVGLVFLDQNPMRVIILQSRYLIKVHMAKNLGMVTLACLQFCDRLQYITIDLPPIINPFEYIHEQDLYRTFFKGQDLHNISFVSIYRGLYPVSFQSAREIWIRYRDLEVGIPFLFERLCQSYPWARLKLTHIIGAQIGERGIWSPFLWPTLQVERKRRKVTFYLLNRNLEQDRRNYPPARLTYRNYSQFAALVERFTNSARNVHTSITFKHYRSHRFYHNRYLIHNDLLERTYPLIHTVYVTGLFPDEIGCWELQTDLGRLMNLKVLCLYTKILYPFVLKGLSLPNLAVLEIRFKWAVNTNSNATPRGICSRRSPKWKDLDLSILTLIKAAPNLKVLEVVARDFLKYLVAMGYLKNVHTLSFLEGSFESMRAIIEGMAELKKVLVGNHISYDVYARLKQEYSNTGLSIYSKNYSCL